MEKLRYMIEDDTIAELLGIQNFSTDEAAVLELVKNAYDANALNLTLEFINDELIITDDGDGMNFEDIKKHWMHIGKSSKAYAIIDKNNKKRIQAGSKGVGRFALARLGKKIVLSSKKNGYVGIVWQTDWSESTLNYSTVSEEQGTRIIISVLREKWNNQRIKRLHAYLEKTYNDTSMKIRIISNQYNELVNLYFPEPEPGKNCRSNIELQYKNCELFIKIISDEFSDDAKEFCPHLNYKEHCKVISIVDEFKGTEIAQIVEELPDKLNEIGEFSANLFFNLTASKLDTEKFFYKYRNTPESVRSGVVLYRNAFSISSYEGEKDWLGLGKRSRKSPAAASHPTGSWRVRENQISGYVLIDKKKNIVLQDLMNRQGLDENIFYQLFIQIILAGIKEFERYRQNIIRKINEKNIVEQAQDLISNEIIKNPKLLYQLQEKDANKLIAELKLFKQAGREFAKEKADVEGRYKYDVRILNVLATNGLKASSIAHEMKTDRNTLNDNYRNIVEALKEYGLWNELNLPEYTKHYWKNVPSLLKRMDNVGQKIISFMDTMLFAIEKRQFMIELHNISQILANIENTWRRDYIWIQIQVEVKGDIQYKISEDLIRVVLDNLILNSIQQNENNRDLEISIRVRLFNGFLHFVYSDTGKGLDNKYLHDARKILEVHETTRSNGHGLGMWIINNTIVMSGGEIHKIEGNNGFRIEFMLGDKI